MPKQKTNMKQTKTEEPAGKTLTKRELVMSISEKTGIIQQDVAKVMQLTLDGIVETLEAGDRIEFREFGVFELVIRKPRIGRNPNKPDETVEIPARKTVKFKPGKRMRQIALPKKPAMKGKKGKGKRKSKGSAK